MDTNSSAPANEIHHARSKRAADGNIDDNIVIRALCAVNLHSPDLATFVTTTTKTKIKQIMKLRILLCSLLAAGLATGVTAIAKEEKNLEAQAKVAKADAEKIALTKAPGGTIKESALEEENGKLIWSFDITMPDAKDITEVQVDAKTGEVVAVDKETPADQEEEAKEEAKEGKEKKGTKLEAQAKITKAEAEKIALTKAPGGAIKEGELEEENDKLIWSFDITLPDTKDITEVQVDAKTGEIVAVDKETPADQEKEAKEEAKEGKEKKEKKGEKKGKKSDKDDDDEKEEKN
jgi:uncharacterized membrane protein YkoI